MLRRIYNFIDRHVRDNLWIIGITILVCWFAFFCLFMVTLDFSPATNEDYQPLIEQQQAIAANFNTVYTYDNYSISPNGKNVEVTLSNNQCALVCSFDENLKYINYEKKDLAMSKVGAISCSLFFGFMFGGISAVLLTMFLPFIISWLLKLLEKLCLILA